MKVEPLENFVLAHVWRADVGWLDVIDGTDAALVGCDDNAVEGPSGGTNEGADKCAGERVREQAEMFVRLFATSIDRVTEINWSTKYRTRCHHGIVLGTSHSK